jgi:hypothetical protein
MVTPMRHIHIYLHQHHSGGSSQDWATHDVPGLKSPGVPKSPGTKISTKGPSTTPVRPPSTVIKPQAQSPHNPPRSQSRVKPMKPAGVIKPAARRPNPKPPMPNNPNPKPPVPKGAPHPAVRVAQHAVKGVRTATKGVNAVTHALQIAQNIGEESER